MSKVYEERVFRRTGELCILSKEVLKFFVQVKAIGKTYHKTCLRCVECGTSLHSNKLLDHDGDPFCVRCHSKVLSFTFTLREYSYLFIIVSKALWTSREWICIAWEGGWLSLSFLFQAIYFFSINIDDWSIYQHADMIFYSQVLI